MRKQQHYLTGLVQLNEWLNEWVVDLTLKMNLNHKQSKALTLFSTFFPHFGQLSPQGSFPEDFKVHKVKRLPYGYFPTAVTVRIHYCQRWHWKRHWTASSRPSSCGGCVWHVTHLHSQSGDAFTKTDSDWLKCVSCFLRSARSTWCRWHTLATLTVRLVISYWLLCQHFIKAHHFKVIKCESPYGHFQVL